MCRECAQRQSRLRQIETQIMEKCGRNGGPCGEIPCRWHFRPRLLRTCRLPRLHRRQGRCASWSLGGLRALPWKSMIRHEASHLPSSKMLLRQPPSNPDPARHLGQLPMFQTYDPPEAGQSGTERVEKLRRLMAKAGLDAVLVPRSDEHQGEYV